jgi:hypothetical protein
MLGNTRCTPLALSLSVLAATALFGCSSGSDPVGGGGVDGGGASNVPQEPGGGGSAGDAKMRVVLAPDWAPKGQSCKSFGNYKLAFATVKAGIGPTISALPTADPNAYKTVDARTITDKSVLHQFRCVKDAGSADEQLYGLLGIDLALENGKKYTLTLTGSTAALAVDP